MTGPQRPWSAAVERRRATDWALFADWCAATGHEAMPADVAVVETFLRQVPAARDTQRRRWHSIRQTHHLHGLPLAAPGSTYTAQRPWRSGPVDESDPDGPQWLGVAQTLAGCPAHGWPTGFHGRRDAWLTVLAGQLAMTRRDILTLTADQISLDPTHPTDRVRVAGQVVPVAAEEWSCPACAVVRWLHVAGIADGRGKLSAKALLVQRPAGHACAEAIPDYWTGVWQLAPSIDRWGMMTEWRALHPRTVSALLAYRQDPHDGPVPRPAPVEEAPGDGHGGDEERPEWDEEAVFALLDERTRAADEVLARIDAYLAADPYLSQSRPPSGGE